MAPDGNGALSQNGCLHTSEKYPATGGGNATPTQGADTRLPPGIFRACGDQPHLPFNAAEKKRSHQIHSSVIEKKLYCRAVGFASRRKGTAI